MSNASSMQWIKQLIFGRHRGPLLPPPESLYPLVVQLESEDISWQEVAESGGLTQFHYDISGDMNLLTDYVEKMDTESPIPTFRTKLVTTLCNHLLVLLKRHQLDPLVPDTDDAETLQSILSNSQSRPFHYQSARFWGELARQWLSHRRPLPPDLQPLPNTQSHFLSRVQRLYDVTCKVLGEWIDPLAMHLVPASEYVNAAHWQSNHALETFLKIQPNHPLSRSIKQVVLRAIHQVLKCERPVASDKYIDTFLQNMSVVDNSVPTTSLSSPPQRVVDVFQRLLAMVRLDDLWQTCRAPPEEKGPTATEFYRLSEKILLADRQNRLLLHHV